MYIKKNIINAKMLVVSKKFAANEFLFRCKNEKEILKINICPKRVFCFTEGNIVFLKVWICLEN